MRIPSSLYSTEARSNPSSASVTFAPVEASIGWIGRKISNPTACSPASPPVIAIRAISVRSPESMSARRAISPRTPAALATASAISPARAPWRRPPVSRPTRKVASGSVARAISPWNSSRRRPRRPAAGLGLDLRDRLVDVGHGERRLSRMRALHAADGGVADADATLARHAGEKADADRHLLGVQRPQQLRQHRHFGRARARRGDGLGGGDDVGEQGHACQVQQVDPCYARVTVRTQRVTAGSRQGASSVRTNMITLARQRVHGHLWPILQTAVAATGAWYIAVLLGVERRPAFAAIAAIVSLGAAFGERRQRAVQLIGGVMLGIVLADLLIRGIGTGLPQIGLLVVLAMVAAVVLGGSELLVTEAAVSAILVSTSVLHARGPLAGRAHRRRGGALGPHPGVPARTAGRRARATNGVFGELGGCCVTRRPRWPPGTSSGRGSRERLGEHRGARGRASSGRRLGQGHRPVGAAAPRLRAASSIAIARTSPTPIWRPARARAGAAHAVIRARRQPAVSRAGGRDPRSRARRLGAAAQFDEPWRSGDVMRLALAPPGA